MQETCACSNHLPPNASFPYIHHTLSFACMLVSTVTRFILLGTAVHRYYFVFFFYFFVGFVSLHVWFSHSSLEPWSLSRHYVLLAKRSVNHAHIWNHWNVNISYHLYHVECEPNDRSHLNYSCSFSLKMQKKALEEIRESTIPKSALYEITHERLGQYAICISPAFAAAVASAHQINETIEQAW